MYGVGGGGCCCHDLVEYAFSIFWLPGVYMAWIRHSPPPASHFCSLLLPMKTRSCYFLASTYMYCTYSLSYRISNNAFHSFCLCQIRSRIHERTISLSGHGTILTVLGLEVSAYTMFTLYKPVSNHFCSRGGGG
jgi:hypothetical protein